MKISRRTHITILTEKFSVATIDRPRYFSFGQCSECKTGVQMLRVDDAARARSVSSRAIYRLVEAGELHFQETADGFSLVCAASLSAIKPENLEP